MTALPGPWQDAVGAIRAGLHHDNLAVREGCCRLLDHLVDTGSMSELIAMADDPDAGVRTAARPGNGTALNAHCHHC
ncbi:MAG: hypothetical protein JWM19_1219 [Actinomycetia bacterium]|nr:hypothetical protein [Actinomycetes bacterium]